MKKVSNLVLVFLLLTCFLEIIWLFNYVSKPQLAAWDEVGLFWQAWQFRKALKLGDWPAFWRLTRNQVQFPFFQNWYLALTTLFFSYSVGSVRFASAILLLPTVLITWFLANQLKPKSTALPLLVVVLILASPTILYFYSVAMKEGLGLLLTLVSVWLYILARKKESVLFYFLTSLSCLALFFTKYYYAFFVVPALGLESLIWLFFQKNLRKKEAWQALASLFLPFLVISIYWVFILPGNFQIIKNELLQNPADFPTTLWTHLLFYLLEMAFGYTFSWLAFLILLLGFFWSLLKHRNNFKVRVLALVFLANFLLMAKNIHKNQARYHFTTIPALFLVGSFGFFDLWPKFRKAFSKSFWLGLSIPVLLLGGWIIIRDLFLVPKMIKPTGSHQVGGAVFYEQDYQNFDRFDFNRTNWPHVSPPAGSERIEDVIAYILENVDVSKNVSQVGWVNEFSPFLLATYVEQARKSGKFLKQSDYQEYLATLEFAPESRFDTEIHRRFTYSTTASVKQVLVDSSLVKIQQKNFPYLGITVTILGRK